MRILFTHHFPLERSHSGRLLQRWAAALGEASHEAHTLVVDDRRDVASPDVQCIVCRPGDPQADLAFDVPYFRAERPHEHSLTFAALSDRQLSAYRDTLRRQLDQEIERFDPHIIHAEHVWVFGQLALETGVPYVLGAWGPELAEYALDARYRGLADQAAENAGRIFVDLEALAAHLRTTFEGVADRIVTMDPGLNLPAAASAAARRSASDTLQRVYQAVLDERFGQFR